MDKALPHGLREKLSASDQQIRRQTALAALGYSLGLMGAAGLYLCFPFALSRIGSVILMVALTHMIWKVYEASRGIPFRNGDPGEEPLLGNLAKVEAQIRLAQSAIYNLPFVAGANLFFMGLPGTGSREGKAWLDCFFLLGTVVLFTAIYCVNQRVVRKQLLPLRQELEASAEQAAQ